ncbi:hypothetical protein ACQJBY_061329 [Aegilops geniculata]
MAKISCFCALLGGKSKKSKDAKKLPYGKRANGSDWQKVKPVESMDGTVAACIDNGAPTCRDTKVVAAAPAELPCQGRGDDKASPARDVGLFGGAAMDSSGYNSDKDAAGTGTPDVVSELPLPATPARLERSCSNIETARPGWKAFDLLLPPAKSRSHGDLATLPAGAGSLLASPNGALGGSSPAPSVRSTCSADRVMLKRRSSSQVLPSRSRKLWWRLFMWSHRNLHRPGAATSSTLPPAGTHHQMLHSHHQQHDGYTSDTLGAAADGNCKNKEVAAVEEEPTCQNQWVAFSAEVSSSLDRVSAWVSSLGDSSLLIHAEEQEEDEEEEEEEGNDITETVIEIGEPSGTTSKGHAQAQTRQKRRSRAAEEAVQQASSIVQTLNAFSSVAHISGMGLKAVPMISAFSSLRAVNLSGNFIAHISAGSLPKGLHSLDLSRNSIATIEGLRELTRLRVLSLSYNRIARIGHGLSSCTALRELYLAGNKISDVEGLHRLLKLAVLDLSFNRVTTARGLGQLVANYNSLRALNLLGNPVQANVGDDALRKAVSGLLPLLAYLNKQALRPQRAREAAKDSVAKAALGTNCWSSRRRAGSTARRSPGSSSARREGSGGRSRSLNGVQARR